MDKLLTFEILLYLNLYYFGLYFGMELLFLFIKFFHTEDPSGAIYNDFFLLFVLLGVESARLYISQEENMGRRLDVIFRILVLTVPSQYLVAYFTFWQLRLTQLDVVMGLIMLVAQFIQLCCAFLCCMPNRKNLNLRMLFSF